MAVVNWIGGTHRISDPAAWTPKPPGPGDEGVIVGGTALAVDEVVGPYTLELTDQLGDYPDHIDTPPKLAAYETSITATIVNYTTTGGSGNPLFDLVGRNTFSGSYTQVGYADGSQSQFTISDVTAPNGAIIQQGVLINTSSLGVGDHYSGMTVAGSADAELVNNGTFGGVGRYDVAVDVAGTGTLDVSTFDGGRFLVEKAVAASQTVQLTIGVLSIGDPLNFRGTLAGFPSFIGGIDIPQQVTAARFVNHVLVLSSGSTVVAELTFADDTTAQDFQISSSAGGTSISPTSFANPGTGFPSNVTVTTGGTVPALPPIALSPPIVLLPSHGPDLTLVNGAHVASTELLGGYTIRLAGSSVANAPSLDEMSTTFSSSFALRVDGSFDEPRYGSLDAVGYNANAGTIAADLGSANLAIAIGDVTSPDGVTLLAGAFNNTGTIDAEGQAAIRITGTADSKLINAGTVIDDAMIFIGPAVTGAGTMTVGSKIPFLPGNLELGGAVSVGQTINLQYASLTIDDPHHFFATVSGFNAFDVITLKGVDVTSVTYNNGALLLDGGADGTLHFHRPNGVTYDTASFVFGHSGADTFITTSVQT